MKQSEKLTETEIIERILKGEKSLYELIVRRFNPYLYKIGRSYNYNHQDTQDLMQETFIDVYKSLVQFQARASFKTWIIRIMMNNCYRKREKSSFKNEIMQDANERSIPLFTTKNNDTDKIIHNRELANIIENALAQIPLDYRMVFSLREITGLNVSETAKILNISEANVKVRLNRAKSMLRNEIENSYSTKELFEFNLVYCDAIVENIMKKIDKL
ncbi:sigma-70 family RNA polymerase sigma factor [Myroides sp. LJL115]